MKKLYSLLIGTILSISSLSPLALAMPNPVPGGIDGNDGAVGDTVYLDSLSANISNADQESIKLVYSQKISFTLLFDMLPTNWETDWIITSVPGVLNCETPSKDQYLETMNCQASNSQYGLVLVSAKNKNNPSEVTNPVVMSVSSPVEEDFISCINAPENHIPSTCIDMFKNGRWERNAQFSCFDGYVRNNDKCEDHRFDINPVSSNNIYQGFGILAADYNEYTQELGVFWEETNLDSNTVPIDRFVFIYNVHDLNSGIFEYNFQTEIYDTFSGEYFTYVDPNKEIYITMEAYAADGTFIGSEDITVDTFSSYNNDPYVEEDYSDYDEHEGYYDEYGNYYDYDDYDDYNEYGDYNEYNDFGNTYFINSAGYSNDSGEVDVQWDNRYFGEIDYFQLYYDVYDYNGNYIHGSAAIDVSTNTSTHRFQELYSIDSGEVIITVNAYDSFGFIGSDQISVYAGDVPYDDYNDDYGYFPYLDISHSFGRYFVVDLTVGEEITFYSQQDGTSTPQWMQSPNQILSCNKGGAPNEYKCVAKQRGDTDVYFSINENGNEFYSPAIVVYVNDAFQQPTSCPIYQEPKCDGNIYYPPAADGCLGKPICKTQGGNIPTPLAGYEDEVTTVYASQQNPFKDVKEADLAGKAAIELFYRGVLGGFPDGEFKGDRPVNRAEAAKFLLLAKEIKVQSGRNNPFGDVPLGEWFTDFVLEAAFQQIIKGYPDGSFGAANGVQTDEFLAMLARTFGLPTGLPHDYKDEAKYKGAWFWEYAGIAKKYQLFPDRKDTLQPERPLTRKEVAIAIYQYLRNR